MTYSKTSFMKISQREIIYDAIKEESDIALEFDKARFSRYISRLRAYQKRAREILSDKIKLLVLSHSVNLNFCSLPSRLAGKNPKGCHLWGIGDPWF